MIVEEKVEPQAAEAQAAEAQAAEVEMIVEEKVEPQAAEPQVETGLEVVVSRHAVESRVLRLFNQYVEQGQVTHEQRMERLKAEQPALYATYLA
jgi:hypothetical protein